MPFTSGFGAIVTSENHVFLATFLLSISSLVLLSAPAVQHRVMRPLVNRAGFKRLATTQTVLGSVFLAAALVLVTQLILSAVLGSAVGNTAAASMGALIVVLWWVSPKFWRAKGWL